MRCIHFRYIFQYAASSLDEHLISSHLDFRAKSELVLVVADVESELTDKYQQLLPNRVFVGQTSIDFTDNSFALFLSNNESLYKSAIRDDCIPILSLSHFQINNSYWLNSLAWKLDEFIEPFALVEWLRGVIASDAFEQKLMNFRIQRQIILNYRLPTADRVHLNFPTVFVGILNRRDDEDRRRLIRETWLSSFLTYPGAKVTCAFFVGSGEGNVTDISQDIISLDVEEEYSQVGRKARRMLDYISKAEKEIDIVIILDDDIYIRPKSLLDSIMQSFTQNTWWGSFAHASIPGRDKTDIRHFVSYEIFPSDSLYPAYTRGFAYAISGSLLRIISQGDGGPNETVIPFGDADLGLRLLNHIVANRINVTMDDRNEENFALIPLCDIGYAGVHSESMIIHKVSVEQMRCAWTLDNSPTRLSICTCF